MSVNVGKIKARIIIGGEKKGYEKVKGKYG